MTKNEAEEAFEKWWEQWRRDNARAAANYAWQSDGQIYPPVSDDAKSFMCIGFLAALELPSQ